MVNKQRRTSSDRMLHSVTTIPWLTKAVTLHAVALPQIEEPTGYPLLTIQRHQNPDTASMSSNCGNPLTLPKYPNPTHHHPEQSHLSYPRRQHILPITSSIPQRLTESTSPPHPQYAESHHPATKSPPNILAILFPQIPQ